MAGVKGVVDEFKAFILRGNVLDLAVAVIIGVAFSAVVEAFTDGILMALIAAIFGEPNFDDITVHLGDGRILIGAFLTAVVNFVLIALALFLVIKAAARLMPRKPEPAEEAPVPSDEALLLTEIRDLLRAGPDASRRRSPPRT
ncbi:MAG TPA: large conductance mechanosensitive channel protein MscL [Acidimicrobiales bacterium]|nr:large conductance mechanosensitive channel protein MscL [Acidimicrobiales bacterium]